MKCSHCDSNVEKKWAYCPTCGSMTEKPGMFDDVFTRIRREFFSARKESREFEKEIEAVDLSPFFKRSRREGFSIRIYRAGNTRPQIEVKTFGNVDKRKIESAVYNQLGISAGVQELRKRAKEIEREDKKKTTDPSKISEIRYTEEPKTIVRSLGDRVAVDIELPGVRSSGQIAINELENSVEIKAVIEDKIFFKILTKPSQFGLRQKTFSNSTLHLEFA